MKQIEYYLKLPYKMEVVKDVEEGGYVASFPDLPGCITCAETIAEAVKNAEEAKREWIYAAFESGISIPEPDKVNEYSGQFKLRMPKSLHKQLAEHSKAEGISMNQYCLFLLTKYDEAYAIKQRTRVVTN